MPNNALDRCTLIPELLKELSPCSKVMLLIDHVGIFLTGRLVCNVLPVVELKSSCHGERSIPRRLLRVSFLRHKVAAMLEESFELDFVSPWGVATSAFQRPYQR
ncbi:hypothetical protein VC83_02755 [Pseudogymnoascus destructans]|uniref:Uncharacterized protein n=1 Tax=Pseudogymnoascus destructans TaxID=655981 RepID=A0A177AID8_9PEZI|nr:uncharacterized protein VC83_02755 [Pseudogymnoascus destructans]OAF60944.1 hypothetical protein VC83_02755 [Pseudogymnoascus destructans]